MGLGFPIHPVPGIPDHELDVPPHRHETAIDDVGRLDESTRRLDGQRAPMRHGVARVDDKIHDDLLELAGIGLDRATPGAPADIEVDVLSDQAPQHGRQAGDDRVEIEHPRRDDLLAAEGEELTGEAGRELTGAQDLECVGPRWIVRRQALDHLLAEPHDDRQQIVEIVGDPAGQAPKGFHLLRLPTFLLETLPLADVARETERANQLALAVDEASGDLDGDAESRPGHNLRLVHRRRAAAPLRLQLPSRCFERLRRHDGRDVETRRFVPRVSGQGFRGRIERREVQGEVGRKNRVCRVFEQVVVLLLARTQSVLDHREPALSAVARGAARQAGDDVDRALKLRRFVEEEIGASLHPMAEPLRAWIVRLDDRRHMGGRRPEHFEHLIAGALRHAEVEDHDVRWLRLNGTTRLSRVARRLDAVDAGQLVDHLDETGSNLGGIVNNENVHSPSLHTSVTAWTGTVNRRSARSRVGVCPTGSL